MTESIDLAPVDEVNPDTLSGSDLADDAKADTSDLVCGAEVSDRERDDGAIARVAVKVVRGLEFLLVGVAGNDEAYGREVGSSLGVTAHGEAIGVVVGTHRDVGERRQHRLTYIGHGAGVCQVQLGDRRAYLVSGLGRRGQGKEAQHDGDDEKRIHGGR